MANLTDIQDLSFQGYKSYKDFQDTHISKICNFNVIIGKNNTGKTSFIDIISCIIKNKKIDSNLSIKYSAPMQKEYLTAGFSDKFRTSFAYNHASNFSYACNFVGKPMSLSIHGNNFETKFPEREHAQTEEKHCWQKVFSAYIKSWEEHVILKINAERDIKPETQSFDLKMDSNGNGASNLVRGVLNQEQYKESLIENDLLQALNIIMGEDACFTRIQIQQILQGESSLWEIFLEEEKGKRFALSRSGSGLKTIILVLLNLLILPYLPEYDGKELIYAFEELENNLHPALQRRLFDYLYSYSITNNVPIFLTTHSHVAIDMFYGKEHAQILHVTKQNHKSSIKKIDNTLDKIRILDDLAVKASDLFQSNGIIWVEGPSDRVYIKKWLEIFGESKFQEGKDYQFLYYGGRLLEKYSAEELENKINILTTNHNSAIVIDSDKLSKHAQLNGTKRRIRDEFKKLDLFCWITDGKEIENYLSVQTINKTFGFSIKKQCEQYEKFPDYIKKWDCNFTNYKVKFAEKIALNLTPDNSNILDVQKQIERLYREISKWNHK